jgi:hypothetical protein
MSDDLRGRIADAILAATYPPDEWPDGPPGEGEMDTAHEQADAVMAVVGPEVKRLAYQRDQAREGTDLHDEFVNDLCMLIPDERDDDVAAEAIVIDWVKELLADRDRARDAAVALEQEIAAVRALHSPFKIYEPCGHEHEETDEGVTNVIEIGPACQDGYMYTVCRHCCTDVEGFQTEECVSAHDHHDGLCDTSAVLDGGEG